MTSVQIGPNSTAPAAPTRRPGGRGLQLDFLDVLDAPASSGPQSEWDGEVFVNRDARRILGTSSRAFKLLVQAGVIVRAAPGSVMLPRGATQASLFVHWASTYDPSPTRRAVQLFVKLRDICGARGAAIPDAVLVASGRVLLESGGTCRIEELAALLRIPRKAAIAAAGRLAVLQAGPHVRDTGRLPAVPWTMGMLVAAVPSLAGAPETCLDPNPRDIHDEPGLRSRARLSACGPVLGPAALFAVVAAASIRREARLEHHMLMLQRFASAMAETAPGADHQDPNAVAATLEYVAFSTDLDGVLSRGVRDMICRSWLMLTDVTWRYARAADSTGERGIRALVPARHPEQRDFESRLRTEFEDLRKASRERRKMRTDPLADSLSEISGRFWERMSQVGDICEAARSASQALLETRIPMTPPCRDFLIEVDVLDDNGAHVHGHPDGHVQEEEWRVWREDDFRASVGLGPVATSARLDLGDEGAEHVTDRPRLIFERLGARALLGDRVVKPFLATLADCGALARPERLDARTLRKRQTVLRTWRLTPPPHLPKGLLWFDEAGEEAWRAALARGRSIVPLEEFEMGMLFAELALNTVLESLCRANAFMQMEQTEQGFPVDDSMPDHAGANFAAIDKTPHGRDPEFSLFPILDQTLVDALDLAERVAKAGGRQDGLLGDVLIEERYRWKRPHPRPFIFQWNGEGLRLSEVTYMLRVLLSNIADVTFHDFRHAVAAVMLDLTDSPEILRRALGHTTATWRYYAQPTARMRRRKQKQRQRARVADLADKEFMRREA